jgi:histidinol-phosphate phosphatase family protein
LKALFLDRDGVINIEKEGSYIFSPEELTYYPGALAAVANAKEHFDVILVVTNQRGIGRGLMSEAELHIIHETIQSDLAALGGKIDAFYFAPGIDSNNPLRKPNKRSISCYSF